MKIAALLVNYRDAAGTAAAARSALDDEPAAEVIVVDNSDDEAHWQALVAALPASVRTVRSAANLGFGRGCNLALQQTEAPLLMLVNPDVRLRRGCLSALRSALVMDPGLGAVAPRQFLDEESHWMLPPAWLPTPLRAWATEKVMRTPAQQARWARAIHAESLRSWTGTGVLRQRALSGSAMMIRRSALEDKTPLFDPRFFMYFEDSDLCMRLRLRGWRMALVADALATHAWRNAPHKGPLMADGMQRYFDKHTGASDEWQERRKRLAGKASWGQKVCVLTQTRLEIGPEWAAGWCVEISPHVPMWPSVGRLGHGPASLELRSVMQAVSAAGPVHIRLSASQDDRLRNARHWTWPTPSLAP